jgi:hypothetical protein
MNSPTQSEIRIDLTLKLLALYNLGTVQSDRHVWRTLHSESLIPNGVSELARAVASAAAALLPLALDGVSEGGVGEG